MQSNLNRISARDVPSDSASESMGVKTAFTWEQLEGQSFPLGATVVNDGDAINFAIYSRHATSVCLLLFNDNDFQQPCLRYEFEFLRNKSGPVWHCRIPLTVVGSARYYGYQIDGPPPARGFHYHCFDAEKLLLDPYATIVHFPSEYDREAAICPGSNVGRGPLGVLPGLQGVFDWNGERKPRHSHDLVIYELHVKGFTANPNSRVDSARRGTFAGVVEKIPYLIELGVTAIELLPIFQFDPQDDDY